MTKPLPSRPDLAQLKKQAKELHRLLKVREPAAVQRLQESHPRAAQLTSPSRRRAGPSLSDAQLVIAREYGFASWSALAERIDALRRAAADPLQLLHQAFVDDDAPRLRQLLERYPEFKAKINEPIGPFDAPAITQVCSRAMLDVLLDAGADINILSRWWAGGFGLLHNAKPDLAAYAIKRGAKIDVHAAARLGLLGKLREILAANPALVHARGGDGQTPLHFASTVEIATWLLDHSADIDARDVDHESTPAQYMVRERQEVARLLVARGCETDILLAAALGDVALARQHLDADPDCVRIRVSDDCFPKANPRAGGTIYQWTLGWHVSPHDVARQFHHDDVLRLVLARSPDDVRLLDACWNGNEPMARSILARNPGIAARLSPAERRQVAHAARNNNAAAVRLLLAIGLPLDARGQHGGTPLHWAAWHGNAEMTRDILAHNPPLETTDHDFKNTPLGWARHGSEHGWHRHAGDYPAVIELLLAAGAKS